MSNDDPIKAAKDSVSLVVEVLKAAGDNPQVKEAADNLGQTAVTLTKTINNVLVPLAAINFAFDKARTYFSGRFQQDISEKTQAIPPEHVVEPKASIAGPTLQGLAFTHEEPDLKEMYLNLLATSMDARSVSSAHPAFVEIIKQLDSEDAKLIRNVLKTEASIPIIEIQQKLTEDNSYNKLAKHVIDLIEPRTGISIENPQLASMIDNWIRLGLVEVTYESYLANESRYSWAEKRPEFLRLSQLPQPNGARVEYKKGVMNRTELGKRFAHAIGL